MGLPRAHLASGANLSYERRPGVLLSRSSGSGRRTGSCVPAPGHSRFVPGRSGRSAGRAPAGLPVTLGNRRAPRRRALAPRADALAEPFAAKHRPATQATAFCRNIALRLYDRLKRLRAICHHFHSLGLVGRAGPSGARFPASLIRRSPGAKPAGRVFAQGLGRRTSFPLARSSCRQRRSACRSGPRRARGSRPRRRHRRA